jgi:hypothetical protein
MLRAVLSALVIIVGVLVVTNGTAGAGEASDSACVPADQAHITATLGSGGSTATFTVQDNAVLCDAVEIGLALYLKESAGFATPQTLATSNTGTITSGTQSLSIALPQDGTAPHCFTQIDAFTGPPLQEITATQDYGGRFLIGTYGTVPNCAEGQVQGASVTAPPASVEATQVSATPSGAVSGAALPASATTPGAVEGAELARTGPTSITAPLAGIGGALLIIGGALLMGANRATRRAKS